MNEESEVTSRFKSFVNLVGHTDALVRHTQRGHDSNAFRYHVTTSSIVGEPTMRELGDEIEKLGHSFTKLSLQMEELSTMLYADKEIACETPKMTVYQRQIQNVFNVMRPLNQAVMTLTTFVLPLGREPTKLPNGKFGRLVKLVMPRPVARR